MHLGDDVTPTYELAIDVQLGKCGPIRVLLDLLPHLRVLEDVNVVVVFLFYLYSIYMNIQ